MNADPRLVDPQWQEELDNFRATGQLTPKLEAAISSDTALRASVDQVFRYQAEQLAELDRLLTFPRA